MTTYPRFSRVESISHLKPQSGEAESPKKWPWIVGETLIIQGLIGGLSPRIRQNSEPDVGPDPAESSVARLALPPQISQTSDCHRLTVLQLEALGPQGPGRGRFQHLGQYFVHPQN